MSESTYSFFTGAGNRGDRAYSRGGNQAAGAQQIRRAASQVPELSWGQESLSAQILPIGLQVSKVESGVRLFPALAPVRAAIKLQQYWALTDQEMARMCGLAPDDAEEIGPALSRLFALPAVQDRLRSAMSIRARLSAVFSGEHDSEVAWLRNPWEILDGQRPIDLLTSREIFGLEAVVREFVGG